MEKLLLICGCCRGGLIDGVTALSTWSVVGFLEMEGGLSEIKTVRAIIKPNM